MKALAINGSPRRNQNTAQLLQRALDGASSRGAETEMIHLYGQQYKGCTSCFSCKRKGNPHSGCSMRDGLTPVLEAVGAADILILGSPLYYMNITSGMSAFLERLLFPYNIYNREIPTVFPHNLPNGFLYTMNMKLEQLEPFGVFGNLKMYQDSLTRTFRESTEVLYACNTYQFSNYEKYESSMFSESEKAAYRTEQFPKDLAAAFELGIRLVDRAIK